MSRLYKILNKRDCVELGLKYSPTIRIILAEHNTGHYTITRYASPFGKLCIVLIFPFVLLWYIMRGIWTSAHDCFCAVYDTFELCDRRDEIWGDDNKYISYLKENY